MTARVRSAKLEDYRGHSGTIVVGNTTQKVLSAFFFCRGTGRLEQKA